LTSLDENDLNTVGQSGPILSQVERLALLTQTSGLDGVVCSPSEITKLRAICGENFYLVVPGIRPSWAHAGDQKRVMTPAKAKALGADIIVIGRPITESKDPALSAKTILNELDSI
jgi:orotidine-5'-phosphate decarboxylase